MLRAIYSKPLERKFREGARNRNKSEDLPCKIRFTAFEEKALNLMTRTSVYHFIHHSDSEKVCTVINSAKSLFMRVRSKGFRPDTFKPKKRKWKRGL